MPVLRRRGAVCGGVLVLTLVAACAIALFVAVGLVSRMREESGKRWNAAVPREAFIAAAAAQTVTERIKAIHFPVGGNVFAPLDALLPASAWGVFTDPETSVRYKDLPVEGGKLTVMLRGAEGRTADASGAARIFRDVDVEAAFSSGGARATVRQTTRFLLEKSAQGMHDEIEIESRGLRRVRD